MKPLFSSAWIENRNGEKKMRKNRGETNNGRKSTTLGKEK
jgi:hypothetical protein